jgi:hypothetical protein
MGRPNVEHMATEETFQKRVLLATEHSVGPINLETKIKKFVFLLDGKLFI